MWSTGQISFVTHATMMNVSTYTLRTDIFEGPLDLLLSLIEKRKLLINDISLAEVADDYLKYLEQHPEFPVAETAQFVLVGSTLLLIKSRSLLPVLSLSQEEQGSIEDLEKRLKFLDAYKAFAAALIERYGKARTFGRVRKVQKMAVSFSPDTSMTVPTIHQSIQSVLQSLPKGKPKLTEATVRKVVSLEDMMERLTQRISMGMQVSFREMQDGHGTETKLNTIVLFLAMLELVRQGVIRVEQEAAHADIVIKSDKVGVPEYK
jgi:segregation and condensation protein A